MEPIVESKIDKREYSKIEFVVARERRVLLSSYSCSRLRLLIIGYRFETWNVALDFLVTWVDNHSHS
jgi:hypothetical protein